MTRKNQLNLSKTDLVLLSAACSWAGTYLLELLPRLRERDLDALLELACEPEEGEEEAEFIKAMESIDSDIRELDLLENRLFEEIEKLAEVPPN
jgi:hypothetical protein